MTQAQPTPDRLILEETDSTNAEAARRFVGAPLWVLARRQSAGVGRRGRAWHGGQGNFLASHISAPHCPPGVAAQRAFVAALAVAEVLEGYGVGPAITLKWPNDVLLEGRKLAGILLESQGQGQGQGGQVSRLTVGIGINLAAAPRADALEPDALPPIALAARVPPPTPEALLDRLAPAYAKWEERLTTQGFAPLRTAWLARAARLGEEIEARLPRATYRGVFSSVDGQGALVLDTPDGTRTLHAADVHFP